MTSKEKTSIEILNYWYKFFKYDCWNTEQGSKQIDKEYYIIARDLARLEKIEEENKKLVINLNVARGIARKRGKAVEIMKKRYINYDVVKICANYKVYSEYVIRKGWTEKDVATEEEYNLVKEVFGYVQ